MFVRPAAASTDPILYVDQLVTRHIGPVSFTVSPGEIVGLVGLRGAGHDIVGRAIFGDAPISGGSIRFDGASFAGTRYGTPQRSGSASYPRSAGKSRSPRVCRFARTFS